jgi:hypothetical protein
MDEPTSLAQALYEASASMLLATPLWGGTDVAAAAAQAAIVNSKTSPPPTAAGRALYNLSQQTNAQAYAIVLYVSQNAVATVSTSTSVGTIGSSTSEGSPIDGPATAVTLPVT